MNETDTSTLTYDDLTNIASDLMNECQVGNISSTLNISGTCESVELSSQDAEIDSILYVPLTPDHLVVLEQPLSIREGLLLTTQPKLRVADVAVNSQNICLNIPVFYQFKVIIILQLSEC